MPEATANGLRFHVQRLGRGHAPGSEAAVMVHGLFSGSLASWYFTAAPAIAKSRPVFLYDLRGHGRTEVPTDGDHSTGTQVADLAALTADLGPFHLVGHSFGALVALRFALANPHRVASLTLVEPPVRSDESDSPAWWWATAAAESGDPAARSGGRPTADPTAVDGPSVAPSSTDRRSGTTDLVADVLASLGEEPEVTDADLLALPAPLAVVLGDRSAAASMAPRVRRVRPDARVLVLPAGHSVHVDARPELTEFLVDFLAGAPAGPAGRSATATPTSTTWGDPRLVPLDDDLEVIAYG